MFFMKTRNILFVAVALIFLATVSCNKQEVETTLYVSVDSISFDNDADVEFATVKTNASGWSAISSVDWIELQIVDSETLMVSVSENLGEAGSRAEARKGTITVTAGTVGAAGSKQALIAVSQDEEAQVFDITASGVLDFTDAGGQFNVKVSYNESYTVSGTTDWLKQVQTKATGEDVLSFAVEANTTSEAREATLVFKTAGGIAKELKVTQAKKAGGKYTVMVYGASGGGDCLDAGYVRGMMDAMNVGCGDEVRMVAQFNFFPEGQKLKNISGTPRFIVKSCTEIKYPGITYAGCKNAADSLYCNIEQSSTLIEKCVSLKGIELANKASDTPLVLGDPNNIANFIKWAAETQPSDNYILIFAGHGGGWRPGDDVEDSYSTKVSCWDNNFKTSGITAKAVTRGIKLSGLEGKIKVLFQDACYMNQMENLAEYATTSIPRAMVSFQSTTGVEYTPLIKALKSGADLDTCMKEYGKAAPEPDWSLWDLTKMPSLLTTIAEAVTPFKADYSSNMSYYNEWMNKLGTISPTQEDKSAGEKQIRDFYEFWSILATKGKTDDVKTKAAAVKKALDDAILGTWYNKSSIYQSNAKVSALFYNKEYYEIEVKRNGKEVFTSNSFYEKTKWNSLFEIFTMENDSSGD